MIIHFPLHVVILCLYASPMMLLYTLLFFETNLLQVRAILLDPSCSGSGTAFDRLDHLLPSANAGNKESDEIQNKNIA